MQYCTRCLYPANHPLGITFDERGICSGCLVHEEKYTIDWDKKAEELDEILSQYKGRSATGHDCIIPVTGTGDDFFVVETIKKKYGLNPLLVTYNHHFNTKVGIRNLARLVSELDCDHMMSTVGPDTVRQVTKATLRLIGDIYWPVIAGTRTFAVQVATKFSIPLIIWGVNGWLDQVGMFSHLDEAEMTKKVWKEHALRRLSPEDLARGNPELSPKDLQAYTYPSDVMLEKSRVRGLYLGNYVFWDSQRQIEAMIDRYGYETLPQERTFNTYETVHCWNVNSVHDWMKYLRYGYGKATDHACRDIRLKRFSREHGIDLVAQYDDNEPEVLEEFLAWCGIEREELMREIDARRDPRAWQKNADGSWTLLDHVGNHRNDPGVEEARLEVDDPREYRITELLEPETKDGYILTGRSYMDAGNYKATEG